MDFIIYVHQNALSGDGSFHTSGRFKTNRVSTSYCPVLYNDNKLWSNIDTVERMSTVNLCFRGASG